MARFQCSGLGLAARLPAGLPAAAPSVQALAGSSAHHVLSGTQRPAGSRSVLPGTYLVAALCFDEVLLSCDAAFEMAEPGA